MHIATSGSQTGSGSGAGLRGTLGDALRRSESVSGAGEYNYSGAGVDVLRDALRGF